MSTPLLLGHRGVRGLRATPENTVRAFDFALAHGCNGFEFDVRLSADGQAVVCHDASFHNRQISKCSAKELKLPLLRDILQRYQNRAFLDIELKVPGLEIPAIETLTEFPPGRGYVITSFLPEVLQKISRRSAGMKLGLICETASQFPEWQQLPVEYVVLQRRLVLPAAIEQLKGKGRKVLAWTVNSAVDMKRFSRWDIDGMISDRPQKLVQTLQAESPYAK